MKSLKVFRTGSVSRFLRARAAMVPAVLALTFLVPSLSASADDGQYCDEPDAVVDCLDPALNISGPVGDGLIDPGETPIDPNEPINIADDGLFDGIYQCTTADPYSSGQVYASVNGHVSGETIFVMASLDPNTDKYVGYGKGNFAGDILAGTTNTGGAFSLQATLGYDANGVPQAMLAGKVRAKGRDGNFKPIEFDVAVNCVSIW